MGSLESYLVMDFEKLKQAARRLIAGEPVTVNVDFFQNDFETFACADDVLTLLIHLGYLTYHKAKKTVRIPNAEIKAAFAQVFPE